MAPPSSRRVPHDGQVLNQPVAVMRFTLVYDGALPAQTAHDGRVEAKHQMRQVFHRQLQELWRERRVLRRSIAGDYVDPSDYSFMIKAARSSLRQSRQSATSLSRGRGLPTSVLRHVTDAEVQLERIVEVTRRGITVPFDVGAFRFVPLVTKQWDLVCELDILFLRAEAPGALFPNAHGDLDNRLKVLFDALRMPALSELPPTAVPEETQRPFFCLMEDDKLITAVRVETERLLDEPGGHNRVQLVVRVTVKARRVNMITMELEGD